jgi:hypothetical protein
LPIIVSQYVEFMNNYVSFLPSFICGTSLEKWMGYLNSTGVHRAYRCKYHSDLHPWIKPKRHRINQFH